jgi:hypothetical protein
MSKQPLPINKIVFGGAALLFGTTVLWNTFFTADGGFTYVVQDTIKGSYTVYADPGFHFVTPFFTKVTEYKQAATINFSGVVDEVTGQVSNIDSGDFTTRDNAIKVTFADTYSGDIPVTFRLRLPRDEQSMLKIHEEFRSFDNLVSALITKSARDVTVITATQYTGEEFFQGGVNQFKVQLEDQLRDGIFVTKREQVTVEDIANAPVSSTNSDASKLQTVERRIMKNVVQLDRDGNQMRSPSPFAEYNIVATQITIGRPTPNNRLDTLLETKRSLVAARITAIEGQLTSVAEAQAIQQKGEIGKAQAIQIAQREKELAIIAVQQQVAVEKQQAERETVIAEKLKSIAVIAKQQELEVAQANLGIQQAAAEAAL